LGGLISPAVKVLLSDLGSDDAPVPPSPYCLSQHFLAVPRGRDVHYVEKGHTGIYGSVN
jgi:hypothetical protein